MGETAVAAPCINDFREASTRIQPYAHRMPLMKVEQTEMKSISKLSPRGNFVPRRIGDLLSEPDWMTVARQELSSRISLLKFIQERKNRLCQTLLTSLVMHSLERWVFGDSRRAAWIRWPSALKKSFARIAFERTSLQRDIAVSSRGSFFQFVF